MTLIRIDLAEYAVSESAPLNVSKRFIKFAKVGGKLTMVLPSGPSRSSMARLKGCLINAKKYRLKANKVKAQEVAAREALKKATTPERKAALRGKVKKLTADAKSAMNLAKLHAKDVTKVYRELNLGDLILPLNPTILADEKKLAAADVTSFGYKGKKGVFVPKFISRAKFDELGNTAKPAR